MSCIMQRMVNHTCNNPVSSLLVFGDEAAADEEEQGSEQQEGAAEVQGGLQRLWIKRGWSVAVDFDGSNRTLDIGFTSARNQGP